MPVPITPPEIDVRIARSRVDDPGLLADELGSSAWLSMARVIKSDGRSSVLSGLVAGRGVIVKTAAASAIRLRAPGRIGRTRLSRQWAGAEALLEKGLPTVEPVLMWSGRSSKGHHAETLVLEMVEGMTLIRTFAEGGLSVREELELADEIGALTGKIVGAGLFNRDHKPSNVIVRANGDGGVGGSNGRLVLIDTAGIKPLGSRDVVAMLVNLAVEMIGTGTLPRRAVLWRVVRACDGVVGLAGGVKGAWRAVEAGIEAHGDPTPKDDPLKY